MLNTRFIVDSSLTTRRAGTEDPKKRSVAEALYSGKRAKNNWIDVASEPDYPLNPDKTPAIFQHRRAAIQRTEFDVYVSLGPGDGLQDLSLLIPEPKVAQAQRRLRPPKTYIPIDISKELLQTTVRNLGTHLPIPFAVQCDFESNLEFATSTVAQATSGKKLYSILGGTIANFDLEHGPFLRSLLRELQGEGEALAFVDFPLAGPAWSLQSEPRLQPSGYSPAFRRFILHASAVANTEPNGRQIRESRFASKFTFEHSSQPRSGAEIIRVINDIGMVVLEFRRFRENVLIDWLKHTGFTIEHFASSISSNRDLFGMAIALLKA